MQTVGLPVYINLGLTPVETRSVSHLGPWVPASFTSSRLGFWTNPPKVPAWRYSYPDMDPVDPIGIMKTYLLLHTSGDILFFWPRTYTYIHIYIYLNIIVCICVYIIYIYVTIHVHYIYIFFFLNPFFKMVSFEIPLIHRWTSHPLAQISTLHDLHLSGQCI